MLELSGVCAGYSRSPVIKDVNLQVQAGEIVSLIGSNGAGKTTMLKTISRLLPLQRGAICFDGQDLATMTPAAVVRAGVAHVPEGRRVFREMTVLENLFLGAFSRADRNHISEEIQEVFELFPILGERKEQLADSLSGGEQQMLAMGRALLARPKLLLLDEPSMGLAPMMVERIFDIVRTIRARGTTILMVEQNAVAALRISDRAYVLENGEIRTSGPSARLIEDPELLSAYLGE